MGSVENLLPDDAPGASPRRCGAPVAIMLYYPDRDFSVNTMESYAPPPLTGAGMAQGGLQIFEKGFLQSQKMNNQDFQGRPYKNVTFFEG